MSCHARTDRQAAACFTVVCKRSSLTTWRPWRRRANSGPGRVHSVTCRPPTSTTALGCRQGRQGSNRFSCAADFHATSSAAGCQNLPTSGGCNAEGAGSGARPRRGTLGVLALALPALPAAGFDGGVGCWRCGGVKKREGAPSPSVESLGKAPGVARPSRRRCARLPCCTVRGSAGASLATLAWGLDSDTGGGTAASSPEVGDSSKSHNASRMSSSSSSAAAAASLRVAASISPRLSSCPHGLGATALPLRCEMGNRS